MTSSRWKFKTKSLFQALFQKSIRTNCCNPTCTSPPFSRRQPQMALHYFYKPILFSTCTPWSAAIFLHNAGAPTSVTSRSTLVWTAEPIWTKVRNVNCTMCIENWIYIILYIYIYDVNSNQNQGCTSRKGSTLSAERSSNSASVQPGHHFPALGRAWLGSNKKTTRKQRSTKSCQDSQPWVTGTLFDLHSIRSRSNGPKFEPAVSGLPDNVLETGPSPRPIYTTPPS